MVKDEGFCGEWLKMKVSVVNGKDAGFCGEWLKMKVSVVNG